MYCWLNSNNNLVFKCTDTSTEEFANYCWDLDSSDADSNTGAGSYTLYNSATANYLSPQDAGVSETLTGTAWWTGNQTGQDYSVDSDEMLVFTIYCSDGTAGSAAFNVEVYGSSSGYITTGSNIDGWYAGGASGDTDTNGSIPGTASDDSEKVSSIATGTTYTVTVQRTSDTTDSGADDSYIITYYDETAATTIATFTTGSVSGMSGDINVHIIAQIGTYNISVETYQLKSVTGTTNSDISSTYSSTAGNTSVDATTASSADEVKSDTVTLSGDFNVTYSFYNQGNYNISSGQQNYYNYILAFNNSNSSGIASWYIRTDEYVYSSGANDANAYGSCVSESFPSSSYTQWAGWRSAMAAGTTCYINVIRRGNTFTVTETAYRNTTLISEIVYEIGDDAFQGCSVTMYLTGIYCSLTDISITDDAATYDWVSYDTYAATGTASKSVTLTASENGFTASAAVNSSTVYLQYSNLSDTYYANWRTISSDITYYLAKVRSFTAYFDGSNEGNYSSYSHSTYYADLRETVATSEMDSTGTYFSIDVPAVELSDTDNGTATNKRANVTLAGWYDIYNNRYYSPNSTVKIEYDSGCNMTVCYADWVASNYNGGSSSDDYYNTDDLDTNGFITTNVFDFNDLINLYSAGLTTKAASSSEYTFGSSEIWTVSYSGNDVKNINSDTGWGFLFIDAGATNTLLLPADRNNVKTDSGTAINANNSDGATTGILTSESISSSLLTNLFGTDNSLYGKTYLGTGNYLYQHNEDSGYYYFDSELNAAFYNQDNNRFYLYNYKVALDSDSSTGDFFPFSYDETQGEGVSDGGTTRLSAANIDYYFGMSSTISFYLPDATSTYNSETQSYGNQTSYTDYSDMVFKFSGDDDVWVVLDYDEEAGTGTTLLDLGGVHGQVYGEIDFSNGTTTVVNDPSATFSYTDDDGNTVTEEIVTYDENGIIGINENYTGTSEIATVALDSDVTTTSLDTINSGSHTLTIFYLERGASQSNAAIYFNISPVYSVQLTKVDGDDTSELLAGAEFNLYTSADFSDSSLVGTYTTDSDGVLQINALHPQVTYYLVETKAPEDYPVSYNYMTIYVDTAGNTTITVYNSDGTTTESLYCNLETNASEDTDSEDLKASVSADEEYNRYLKNSLSVYGKSDETYGSYFLMTLTYANYHEYVLPATGGIGTDGIYRCGRVILAGGLAALGVLLYEDKRRRRLKATCGPGDRKQPSRWNDRTMNRQGHSRDISGEMYARGDPQKDSKGVLRKRFKVCTSKMSKGCRSPSILEINKTEIDDSG